MNGVERAVRALSIVVAALGTACSTLPAPREWVAKPYQVPQDVHGAWANVRHRWEGERVTTSGELISVSPDSIHVRAPRAGMQAFSWTVVDRVQIAMFDPTEGAAYGLGFAGMLASLSHGWFFVFSAPVWIAVGAGTGAGRVDEAVLQYPRETKEWQELAKYARFPQGPPSSFWITLDSTVVDSTIAASPPPAETGKILPAETEDIPDYHPPEKGGNGIVAGGGFFFEGKAAWTVGYHLRVREELFALGGYSQFDDDAFDMDQWWIGLRAGDPAFIGVKYIYTSLRDDDASGVSVFAGVLKPTSQHIAIGAMAGYDITGHDFLDKDEFWWVTVVLQLTLFPFEE